jgi:hypothetical protein
MGVCKVWENGNVHLTPILPYFAYSHTFFLFIPQAPNGIHHSCFQCLKTQYDQG